MDILQEHLFATPKGRYLSEIEIKDLCEEINLLTKSKTSAALMLPQALAIVRAAPKDFRPQLLALRLMERARHKEHMLDSWTALHDRFPHLHEALRFMVRWLNRDDQISDATQLLYAMIETNTGDYDVVDLAELCAEIKDVDQARQLFSKLIELAPENTSIRVIYGKALMAQGEIFRAFDVLSPIKDARLSKTARKIVDRSNEAHGAMSALGEGEASVLSRAIGAFSNRKPRLLDTDRLNGICFYTGSLGAGGAERQLTQMASAFHHRKRAGRNIHGTRLTGQIEVIVNNVDKDRGKNFFGPALKASGVALSVTSNMPCADLSEITPDTPHLSRILPMLPRNVRYGLERLTAHFRKTAPDVAYFWQDGAVLTGVLAALVAEVPRIAISLRGLPPNLRPNMMKPEYPDLYRALSKIPGVSFSCNSRSAANAYADWLNLPRERFSVIYNAVRKLPDDGEQNDHRRWALFDQETAGASFTLGGIFRFNPNKRALLWLDYAKAISNTHPNTRFILVGEGEELAQAQKKVSDLDLDKRVLFVGNSKSPGYWLSKMDTMCLLSENEGLPNVLIEAQMAGIPVISTPAGGASETFEDGTSGYLMSSAKSPFPHEFEMYANTLITQPALRQSMGEKGRRLALEKFDRETIFAQTIRFFLGETIAGDLEHDLADKITTFEPARVKSAFDPRVHAAYKVVAEQ